jgi:hypothetical protein
MSDDLVEHVHSDIEKVYRCLIRVWASYLSIIEKEDPYLYRLTIEQSKKIRSGV